MEFRVLGRTRRGAEGLETPHYFDGLQRLQPIKNVDISAPGGTAAKFFPYRISFREGGSLHLQVYGCIAIGSIDAGMAQPVGDRGHIYA